MIGWADYKLSASTEDFPDDSPDLDLSDGFGFYRNYKIWYDPPPIPDRRYDWHFAHEQFDGAPDSGDHRCGDAASFNDCMMAIDEIEDDK